jgi:hypothetical protein
VAPEVISLIDADPELGEQLDPGERESARRDALTRVQRSCAATGSWRR